MKKLERIPAFLIVLSLIIALSSCVNGGNSRYQVAERLEEQRLAVGFRDGDRAGDIVIAALKVLQSSGRVREISLRWFGEDVSIYPSDPDAITNLDMDIEQRTFIVGFDDDRLPLSGVDGIGNATGFDAELARAVCDLLGWRIKHIAIDMANAETELRSGNVDCVWGGFTPDPDSSRITVSPAYMRNSIVLAALSGSRVRSVNALSGRTLTVSRNYYFNALLDKNPALRNRPEFVINIPGGTSAAFRELNSEATDAIITDRFSLDYYLGRN